MDGITKIDAITYFQNHEDLLIAGFFPDVKNGFYVDVGANHPDLLSITKIFYDNGWSGINLELNRHLYNLINKHRSRDAKLNIGASGQRRRKKVDQFTWDKTTEHLMEYIGHLTGETNG